MEALLNRYRALKSNKRFHLELAAGILLMCAALFLNYYANNYAATEQGAAENDIILDHIPVVDVEYIFLEGALALGAIIILLGLQHPGRIPFMLKTWALFILMRAFFMCLTHLAPPLHEYVFHSESFLERFIAGSGYDLFFSGHTGLPFLMALVFWESKPLRVFFLLASICFGAAVLLGHLHYSIDVFSAFFISYGIYHIALELFKKDYELFKAA